MKILYIAFACNPYIGSEAQCGWAWPVTMRKYADVSVVTRRGNKSDIEKYMREHQITDIQVYYHDIPDVINPYYKTGNLYIPYYFLWQKTSFKFIRELHKKNRYEYIHHVTLGDFRLISPAWKLNTRFIFGPVGGAQLTPESLRSYTLADQKTERKREWINRITISMYQYKKAINHAWLVLAANGETQKYLQKIMKRPYQCRLLTENGVTQEQIHEYPMRTNGDAVVLLWAGRMINRKGLGLLLDVLNLVKTQNNYRLKLVGDGPEKEKLINQSKRLGIDKKIDFVGAVSYNEMQKLYLTSDIFIFPSLRETTGTVLFEAMASGLPIVTFDQNGAALLVTDTCGYKVNIHQSADGIKKEFADKISRLIDSPQKRKEMGKNAYLRVMENYTWTVKCGNFFENYMR